MSLLIRDANHGDVHLLVGLCRDDKDAPHWASDAFEQYVHDRETALLRIAEVDKSIYGFYAARSLGASEWELDSILVIQEHRCVGFGGILLQDLLTIASARSEHPVIHLEVRESNHPARRFYEKHRFRPIGRRPRYYAEPEDDAVLYALTL